MIFSFLLILIKYEKFLCFFFLKNWVGVVIEGDMLKGFNIDLRSSGTYFPLICPRDGQKIPTQHSNTRKPANTTTWFCQTKFRIICYFLAAIFSFWETSAIYKFTTSYTILRKQNGFWKHSIVVFLQNRFQEIWQFSKCLKISYLRKVKLQNWWLIFLIRILQSLKLLTPLNIIGVVKETAAVNNTILQNKKH